MKLKKGKYHIKVSKKGYTTIKQWISLEKDEYFTVALKQVQKSGLPAHAKLNYYGNGWECKRGYHRSGNQCLKVGIPAHAKLNYYGNGWECKRGYHRSGNQCLKVGIPAHAKLNYYGNGWECKSGYHRSGNQCLKVGTR